MKNGIGERLSELCKHEATNFAKSLEYLGTTAELAADVDDLYQLMPMLVGPETKSHDELLADELIRNNFLMCRVLLSKGTLAALRSYGADSTIHLRRAIEACAFSARMRKHPDLCQVYCDVANGGAEPNNEKYRAYMKAFGKNEFLFPKAGHADHHPTLELLYKRFDICSKMIHGSIYGMAAHFANAPKGETPNVRHINYFDLNGEDLFKSIALTVRTHTLILSMFAQLFRLIDPQKWGQEWMCVSQRLDRHVAKFGPSQGSL
jgi:hypothetical protein